MPAALQTMRGSLVRHADEGRGAHWYFKHPTVGDAYGALLAKNPELLGIYILGTHPDRLMTQVTCGSVGLEHAVAIPDSLFSVVLSRLESYHSSSRWEVQRRLDGFLARRCSASFLRLYLATYPATLDRLADPGMLFSAVSEVPLAARLHELQLLPEQVRARFMARVTECTLDGDDLSAFESKAVQTIFGNDFASLRARVASELIPRLADVRRSWQSNDSAGVSAADQMAPLIESLEAMRPELRTIVEIDQIDATTGCGQARESPTARDTDILVGDMLPAHGNQPRSIFDDVDD